jgi:methylamine---glutamate N-methyltransferase subunit B
LKTTTDERVVDLTTSSVRDLNHALHQLRHADGPGHWHVREPRGAHAVACGLDVPVRVEVDGPTGYYCAGMNQQATVILHGNTGTGVAENMMSGLVHVKGNASQSAGASGHGGLLIIDGNAAARCGISMKGIDIVVKGSIGPMSAFMAQSGNLVVLGDAGEALGDSIYEARLFVRGNVVSLGADCIEKDMGPDDRAALAGVLTKAELDNVSTDDFKLYGSARRLYHFHVDNVDAY